MASLAGLRKAAAAVVRGGRRVAMWVRKPGVEWPGDMRIFLGALRGWKMGVVILDVEVDVDVDILFLLWWCGLGR